MPKRSSSKVVSAIFELNCAVNPCYEIQNRAFGSFNLPFLVELVSQNKVRRALDVGCGEGSLILQLASQTPRTQYDAVEVNPELVKFAKSRQLKKKSNVIFINEAFGSTFFGKNYDLILARFAVEHMTDVDGFLRTAKNKLTKRGVLAITEYYVTTDGISDPVWLEFRKRELLVYKKTDAHTKSSLWLPELLAKSGYKNIKSVLTHVSPATIGARDFFDLVRVYAEIYAALDPLNWPKDFVSKILNWCAKQQKKPSSDPTMWVSHTTATA